MLSSTRSYIEFPKFLRNFRAAIQANVTISTNQQQSSAATIETAASQTDKFLHYSNEEGYYKTSPFEPITLPNITLDKYIWRDFKKWENRVATVSIINEIY